MAMWVEVILPLSRPGLNDPRVAPLTWRTARGVGRRVHCSAFGFFAFLFLTAIAQAQGTVVGSVRDQAEVPVRDAVVEIKQSGLQTRTDSVGRFRFPRVGVGLHVLTVRRPGFVPASASVLVAAGDSVRVGFQLKALAQPLPAVPVEAALSGTNYRLRDFERRRTSGVGHFLTAADLLPERSKPMADVLTRLPGTQIVRSSSAACLTTTRGAQSVHRSATGLCGNQFVSHCPVAVFVDGVPSYGGHSEEVFNLNAFRADQVAGVEFYSGSATIPRELAAPRGTCGVLVIWTK